MHDIIIIGGGTAGLTAALYALRAGKSVLVIEKNSFGGQIAYSPMVENWPGTAKMSGLAFADALTEQVMQHGAEFELERVTAVEKSGDAFRVLTEEGGAYDGRTVIVAAGVKHRMLGLPGENELVGEGISFCAVCDGAFYAGQDVVVVGGGNSALQEALLLSETSKTVTILQDMPGFTGEKRLAETLMARENVRALFGVKAEGYVSENGQLCGLDVRDGSGVTRVACTGAFLAVGLIPENQPFASLLELDGQGYLAVDESCQTAVPGVFVAGDCRAKRVRQLTTASGDGAVAALAAVRYIDGI